MKDFVFTLARPIPMATIASTIIRATVITVIPTNIGGAAGIIDTITIGTTIVIITGIDERSQLFCSVLDFHPNNA